MEYYLAIDIGASSGRHILGSLENGKIRIEEIYRFKNEIRKINGNLCWDSKYLFNEIISGMKKCKELNKIPKSVAIDTWGVDYAALDKNGNLLNEIISYRDHRTDKIDKKVYEKISLDELYKRTGIQKQKFNTIYQLSAQKENNPEQFSEIESILLMPDYFNYLLTGIKKGEYTNLTTTQLINIETNKWDYEILEKLDIPKKIFPDIIEPGEKIGNLLPEISTIIGYNCDVLACASHDTASAVISVPALEDEFIYLSSGTWSLMGTELKKANNTPESQKLNFTNEGGYEYRFRYLKNIMGLWIIQNLQKELKEGYTFAELCELAEENKDFSSIIEVNDERFLSPESMILEIKKYCQETNQKIPKSPGELAYVVYKSLAVSYSKTVEELERITGKEYKRIYIVGGGVNADYLNRLTQKYTKKEVFSGPSEATATGNIIVQMIKDKKFSNLKEARKCILKSFEIKKYKEEEKNDK